MNADIQSVSRYSIPLPPKYVQSILYQGIQDNGREYTAWLSMFGHILLKDASGILEIALRSKEDRVLWIYINIENSFSEGLLPFHLYRDFLRIPGCWFIRETSREHVPTINGARNVYLTPTKMS